MRRLWPVLLALLGLTLLAAAPASAAVATQLENRISGLPSVSNNLIGIEPRLSENAVRENVRLGYEVASGSPVAARGTATGFRGSRGFELSNAPYQAVRNSPATIGGRQYSGHALDQMQNRGLMPSVVENTIRTGTPFPTRAGTTGYFDAVNNVRVITDTATGRVVTVIPGAP